jgi:hypothetical protein
MQRCFTSDRLHTHPSPNDNMSVEARASVSHKELIFLEMDRNRNTLKEYRSDKKPIKLYNPVKSSPVCRERAHKMRSAYTCSYRAQGEHGHTWNISTNDSALTSNSLTVLLSEYFAQNTIVMSDTTIWTTSNAFFASKKYAYLRSNHISDACTFIHTVVCRSASLYGKKAFACAHKPGLPQACGCG